MLGSIGVIYQMYLFFPNTESYGESVLIKTDSEKILILLFLPALRHTEGADLTSGLHHSKPFFIHNGFNISEFVILYFFFLVWDPPRYPQQSILLYYEDRCMKFSVESFSGVLSGNLQSVSWS